MATRTSKVSAGTKSLRRITNIEDKNELRRIDPKLSWSDKYKGFESATEIERQYCHALLAVPIKIESVTIGVLRVAKTMEPNARFTAEHEDLLVTLAEHLSSIVIKAERIQKSEQLDKLLDHDDPGEIESQGELDNYFNSAANLIPNILNSSGCTMFLREDHSNSYVLRYASRGNPLEELIDKARYKANEGLTGYVLQYQRSLRINDIQNQEELHQIDPKLKWQGVHLEFQKSLGKEVILLAQDPKKVPVDLSGSRVLVYSPERLDKLEDDLARKLSRLLKKQQDDN